MTIPADPTAPALPTADDVHAAAERLRGVAHRTPVMTSRTLDERLGAHVFFKCENLQRAGAFKFRGAYNAVSLLSDEERARGVLAYSSGNHAQAVALALRRVPELNATWTEGATRRLDHVHVGAATAQQPSTTPPVRSLSIGEAVGMAKENNPSLQQQRNDIGVARSQVRSARDRRSAVHFEWL